MKIGSNIRNVSKIDIGETFPPVIFAHVGVGEKTIDLEKGIEEEKEKIALAIKAGVNAIVDVSLSPYIKRIQEEFLKNFNICFGSVSIYETYYYVVEHKNANKDIFLDIIKEECKRGLDLITLHATVFKDDRRLFQTSERIIPTTSRGGMMMLEIMEKYNIQNPYFVYFDEILDIVKEYDVAISLGPMYRPASVVDGSIDALHIMELERMGELTKNALDKGVTILVEGIGHASIDRIPYLVKKGLELTNNVPYRVMSVANDISLGYDHISSAIAHANAIYSGASSITAVSRMEHIGIPKKEDTYEAVIAARVAAYSGYIARTHDYKRDKTMSEYRKIDGCIGNIDVSLFPDIAKENNINNNGCTMCGAMCPLRKVNSGGKI